MGSHTCAFSNAQGAQVCEANLMSRTKAIVGKEVNIKNKVRAGLEVVANDTLSPPQKRSPSGSFFVAERVGLNMKYFCKFNFFHINFEEKE